jgi:uncharacterized peroxidase-related enzyme
VSFVPSFPDDATLRNVFTRWTAPAKALCEYHEALMRSDDSSLSHAEMELIAAYVSRLNGCRYCLTVHTAVAEKMGFPEGLVDRLIEDETLSAADDRMRPVLHYARKLTQDVRSVTQDDYNAMLDAGLDEQATHEVIGTIALFNFMNRFIEGFGIELPPTHAGPASDSLAERGYSPIIKMIIAAEKAQAK